MTDDTPAQNRSRLRTFGFLLLGNAAFLAVIITGAALLSGRTWLLVVLLGVIPNVWFASRQFAQARNLPE